jgi:hypothetical protein
MEIYSSLWHVFGALGVVFVGGILAYGLTGYFGLGRGRGLLLYFWHTLFCLVYLWYSTFNIADATGYFEYAKMGIWELGLGTAGVNFLTTVIVRTFGLSILGAYLFFNIFGAVGLLAFDASLKQATQGKSSNLKSLATLIVFLPSVSFWSSAIGKDSLAFMASGLALWAALNLGRRWLLMTAAVLVMLVVRPHIAGLMILAWIFALMVGREIALPRKLTFAVLLGVAVMALTPFVVQYVGLAGSFNTVGLFDYVEVRQTHNMEGGTSVDLATMSLPMKLFSYVFRPSVFEARTLFSLVAAFDNLVLLYLFLAGIWGLLTGQKSSLGESRTFLWGFFLLTWPVLALTTANLGIATRQKWMFAPMLIFLLLSAMGSKKQESI